MHKSNYLRGTASDALQTFARKRKEDSRRLPSDILFKCIRIKEKLLSSAVIEIASQEFAELEEK